MSTLLVRGERIHHLRRLWRAPKDLPSLNLNRSITSTLAPTVFDGLSSQLNGLNTRRLVQRPQSGPNRIRRYRSSLQHPPSV